MSAENPTVAAIADGNCNGTPRQFQKSPDLGQKPRFTTKRTGKPGIVTGGTRNKSSIQTAFESVSEHGQQEHDAKDDLLI